MNETLPEYNQMIRKSKQEGKEEGIKIGKKESIKDILKEISKNPNMSIEDLRKYLKKRTKNTQQKIKPYYFSLIHQNN